MVERLHSDFSVGEKLDGEKFIIKQMDVDSSKSLVSDFKPRNLILNSSLRSIGSDRFLPLSPDTSTYTNIYVDENDSDDMSEGEWMNSLEGIFSEFMKKDEVRQRVNNETDTGLDSMLMDADIKKLEKVFKARKRRKFMKKNRMISSIVKTEDSFLLRIFRCIKSRVKVRHWLHHPDLFYKMGWLIVYLRLQVLVAIIYQMPLTFIPDLYRGVFYPFKLIGGLDFSSYFNEGYSKYLSAYIWVGYGFKAYFSIQFVIFWVTIPTLVIILWIASIVLKHHSNEKVLFVVLRILYFPVLIKFGPWLGCGGIGNIHFERCETNIYFLILFSIFAILVPVLWFFDLKKRILYHSPSGHLEYMSFLETEKLLRFSNCYQKMKMYKVSCFRFQRVFGSGIVLNGAYFTFLFDGVIVPWILIVCWIIFGFQHPKYLCACTSLTLSSLGMLEFLFSPFRLKSFLFISQASLWTTVTVSFLCWMKAVNLMNPFFVDNILSVTLIFFTLFGFVFVLGIMTYSVCKRSKNWPVCGKEIKRREPEVIKLIQKGYFLYFYSIQIHPYFVRVDVLEYFIGVLQEKMKKIVRVEGHPLVPSLESIIYKLSSRFFELKDISLFSSSSQVGHRELRAKLGDLRKCLMRRQIDTCHIQRNRRRVLYKFLILKEIGKRIREFYSVGVPLEMGNRNELEVKNEQLINMKGWKGVRLDQDMDTTPLFENLVCHNYDSHFYTEKGGANVRIMNLDDENIHTTEVEEFQKSQEMEVPVEHRLISEEVIEIKENSENEID